MKLMKFMKFAFTIIIFVCWSTSIATQVKSIAYDEVKFPDLLDESLQSLVYENELADTSLDFNTKIANINKDFISSPLITCLNLTANHIENIEEGAFNKLPNLTQLFLSNNRLSKPFNFGSHYKLQILILNNVSFKYSNEYNGYNRYNGYNPYNGYNGYNGYQNNKMNEKVQIFGEFPNLEILSLRQNDFSDLYFTSEKTLLSEYPFSSTMVSTISDNRPEIPFPKLQILDFSENHISQTNFVKLLPNSLYFLDLHNNLLESLDLNNITNKLYALNLNNNKFHYIYTSSWPGQYLSVAGLKNLHYLSISTNNITNIESKAFQDNNNLLYLNLSANAINDLHPETFANLQYLKMLDLSKNKLKNVPQISNEIGISTLYINHNNITKLISHTFVQMPKLTKLLLGENQIDEIDINAFANLTMLEELDLSRNILSFLPEGWTESLISLRYLDLSANQFTSLESLSLTNTLPSIIEIYLMMNSLDYLNVRYFQSLSQNLTINLIHKSSFAKWV